MLNVTCVFTKENSQVTIDSWKVIQQWEQQNIADNVRSEYSKIDPNLVWNIELVEVLNSITDTDNLYYLQYFMRFERPANPL